MILFRADGNSHIGTGHVMRCLSVAAAARDRNEPSCFAVSDPFMEQKIKEAGFPCFLLRTDYRDPKGEKSILEKFLKKTAPDCIVSDSYFVTAGYLNWLRSFAPVIYIDDRAAFAYPVDVLVNYNIFGPKTDYRGLYENTDIPLPKLLLGGSYAPLRKEFQGLKRKLPSEKVKDIFISTGGADSEHVALSLIRYLQHSGGKSQNCRYHFVLGAMNPDIAQICEAAEKLPHVILHQDVRHMQKLMDSCDIAVSAAGSTLYELCACSMPVITYVLADNQIPAEKIFQEEGIMLSAGDFRKESEFPEKLFQLLQTLGSNYALRKRLSQKAYAVTDGNGSCRIAAELITYFQTDIG